MSRARNNRRNLTARDDLVVKVVAALGALGAAFGPARPTGNAAFDVVWQAALAAVVVLATARARRWSWLVLAAVAAAGSSGLVLVLGWGSLVLAVAASLRDMRLRLVGAIVGALAINALLRQEWELFHGASVLVGAAAIGCVLVSGHRRSRSPVRRRHRAIALGVAGFVVLATAAFAVSLLLAVGHLSEGSDHARAALRLARDGDTAEAEARLASASASLRSGAEFTDAWWAAPARLVPLVSQHAEAVRVSTSEGLAVAEAGRATARLGDYQELKYASGRIDLDRVRDLAGPLGNAAAVLRDADDSVTSVDRAWLVTPLRDRLDDLQQELDDAAEQASLAEDVLDVVPGLLGGDGDRTYLIAFLNPAEQRGLGGFVGNYAEITASDGEVRLTRSGPTNELERAVPDGVRSLDGPEEYLDRYGVFQPADYLRDVSYSPHFPYVADVLGQLYPQSGGTKVDGVFAIDPYTLARLLAFTGPIQVPGYPEPLTQETAADFILKGQYEDFAGANQERKDVLVDATRLVFERLLTGDLPAPERLVQALGPMVDERRLLLSATREPEQAVFHRLGADGAMPRVGADGDLFSVVHQNFANNKIDAYLQRTVDYRTTVDAETGAVAATATVTFANQVPARLASVAYVASNSRGEPPGTNMMNVTVYSTLGRAEATLDGEPLDLLRGSEVGANTYTARVNVPAGATRTLVLELAGAADLGGGDYEVVLVPQPAVVPDRLTADVASRNGRMVRRTPTGTGTVVDGRWQTERGEFTEPVRLGVELER